MGAEGVLPAAPMEVVAGVGPEGGRPAVTAAREELRVEVPGAGTEVAALLDTPPSPVGLLLLAHGAGAGMRHAFMEAVAERLTARSVAVLRYQFPYKERGGKRPDRPPVAMDTVAAATGLALDRSRGDGPLGGLPVFAGGKSFGGRMTSQAAAAGRLEGVAGLVFFGFPLHAPGRRGTERAAHLADVAAPMLFLQGTRDALADLTLLAPVLEGLGERAGLHVVEGADHGFHVLKRSGRTDGEVLDELAETASRWMKARLS